MADLCMCGHEEREHAYDPTESRPVCFGNAMACPCARYRRSPLSAFRGPAVTFTREEAAGWVAVLLDLWASRHVLGLPEQIRAAVRMYVRQARWSIDVGRPRDAARLYLAARILRAVRP